VWNKGKGSSLLLATGRMLMGCALSNSCVVRLIEGTRWQLLIQACYLQRVFRIFI